MTERSRKPHDSVLIPSLARGVSVAEAAELAGLSERTVYRRLEEDGFRREVANHRRALIDAGVGALAEAVREAVETLQELQRDAESETVRARAATAILAHLPALREHGELADRLDELEARLEAVTDDA